MDLLNLEENQQITIEKEKYKILNRIEYTEKSSYWVEYKLQNIQTSKYYYLNVELSSEAILYETINQTKIDLKMNIKFQNEEFELFEKGIGKVKTYYGMTDVCLNDEVNYYEYKSKGNLQKVLSIEKWKDKTQISIGKIISFSKIKL